MLKNNFNKYKSVFFHMVGFSIILFAGIVSMREITSLDMFDLFNMLYKFINITTLFMFFLIAIAIFVLFSENKKIKKDIENLIKKDIENFKTAEKNRIDIKSDMHELKNILNRVNLTLQVKVVNHIELKEKLLYTLNAVSYNRDTNSNALFKDFFKKVIQEITIFVRAKKQNDKKLTYLERREFLKVIENLLIAEQFVINTDKFLPLADAFIGEYLDARKNSELKKEDIISDIFFKFVQIIYEEYLYEIEKLTENEKKEIENQFEKTNSNNTTGDNNANLQDLAAQKNINIHFK